jgi:hypothetical protein
VKETRTQQANKLFATEMDFWRRSAGKPRGEKVRNITIKASMDVGKKILKLKKNVYVGFDT